MVLAPTRELAQQIDTVAHTLCDGCGVSVACVFGGVPKEEHAQAVEQGEIRLHSCQPNDATAGVDLVIATPGRLIDLLESGDIVLQQCSLLVLDEADRMLDMGFGQQLRVVAGQIRPDRQTLMFTATWPRYRSARLQSRVLIAYQRHA